MSKASESKLAVLHSAVATVLTEQVLHEEEETIFDGEGETIGTGVMVKTATPALLATAARFLKDNDITCDIEQDENLSVLKKFWQVNNVIVVLKTQRQRLRHINP